MCPAYVAGLIAAGDRRSVQPMAARDDQVGYDQLHHFVAARVWDSASRSDSPRTSEGTRK
jgi:SRSO17 transposase